MRRSRVSVAGLVAFVGVALIGLVGCEPNYEVKIAEVDLAIPCGGTTTVKAQWAVPQGTTPAGFIWLNHGFARNNDNMTDLQTRYAARGCEKLLAECHALFPECELAEDFAQVSV